MASSRTDDSDARASADEEPPAQSPARPAGTSSGLGALGDWLRALLRGRQDTETAQAAFEELLAENPDLAAEVAPDQRQLIANILELSDMTAEDVMVPRADIAAAPADATLDELVDVLVREAHSRMPVQDGDLDHIVGYVHIKDVLAATRAGKPATARALARKILFVAPSIKVLDLLLEMRAARTHIALVVDEYGGVDGLITIEDLVEEIVGEIEDEHDEDDGPALVAQSDGTILADARAPIEELEELIGPFATDEEHSEIDSLAGIVFALVDRVPRRNEVITHPAGVEFVVVDADPRRIRRLRVRRVAPRGA
ncbi:MAG: transporter associated domain-containing protein [Alphaproteobacteria bacterium]